MKYFNLYAKFRFLYFISTPFKHLLLHFWFYLRYKIRKLYKAQCCPFSGVLKVANFFFPYLCSVFLLLGRKPVVRIFSTNYAKFFCLFLLWLCINILRDFGECCESVPLDRPWSYVSISINIYITIILARVVQVDALVLSISKLVTFALQW